MIGRSALAAAMLAAMTTAASAVTEWRGGTFLNTITPQCTADGFVKGDYYDTRYRHPNVGGANDETRMVFLQSFSGMGVTVEGTVGKEYKDVQAGYVGSNIYFDDMGSQIKFSSIYPAKIDKNTPAIIIEGSIKNFGGVLGCEVGFRSTLGLRPE
jgi:hypothetical protein